MTLMDKQVKLVFRMKTDHVDLELNNFETVMLSKQNMLNSRIVWCVQITNLALAIMSIEAVIVIYNYKNASLNHFDIVKWIFEACLK